GGLRAAPVQRPRDSRRGRAGGAGDDRGRARARREPDRGCTRFARAARADRPLAPRARPPPSRGHDHTVGRTRAAAAPLDRAGARGRVFRLADAGGPGALPPDAPRARGRAGSAVRRLVIASLAAALVLTSPAFHTGGTIPVRYTCDGADVSPPLRWTAPP